jgi:GNAT superfamily N-acetyltransferase
MPEPSLRVARREDAVAIVELVRQGFEPSLLEAFVYGCSGAARYVGAQIEAREKGGDTAYFVAELGGAVCAMIEMRSLVDRLFLNYVAVDPGVRHARVGSRLLCHAIEALARPNHASLSLDVLDDNAPAVAWYRGLGLTEDSRTRWHVRSLGAGDPGDLAALAGLPQAAICQRELGFSMFTATTQRGSYAVGMLGERWFRVTSAAALEDAALLAALRRLDARRDLLALLPEGTEVDGTRPLALTRRLTGELGSVRMQLRAKEARS